MPPASNRSMTGCVIVISGKIRIFLNRKWKQRFCVIARTSQFAATLKLFVYKEPTDYNKSIDLSTQQPYDIVYGLDSVATSDKSPVKTTLVLTCEERVVLLGFNCYSDLVCWLGKIGDSVQDASYRVKFVKCDSVGKQSGQQAPAVPDWIGSSLDGRLHVQPSRLCFYTEPADACRVLAVWPMQFVKRYMVNDAIACFAFEGEVGCGRFRGLQYFQCERRYDAYADMKAACVNKPMPSLSRFPRHTDTVGSPPGAVAAPEAPPSAASSSVSPRPASSSCIDIPPPRGCQHPQQRHQDCSCCRQHRRHRHDEHQRRNAAHCRQHPVVESQRPHRLQHQQSAVDSGYEGAGSRGQSVGAAGSYSESPHPAAATTTAAVASHREYYNLLPGSGPTLLLPPPPPLPSTTDAMGVVGPLVGFSRSISISEQQEQCQKHLTACPVTCRSRRVRSSIDVRCCESVPENDAAGSSVGGAEAEPPDCCDSACAACEMDDADPTACCCGYCCCTGSCGSPAPQLQRQASPVAKAVVAMTAACADDVRTRKPRHGFEYASRQRVTSLSSGSCGCYANLPLFSQQPIQSAPAADSPAMEMERQQSPLLVYALLDHSPSSAAACGATSASHSLNYTEVDHGKTMAFRDIAAELRGSRSVSTSAAAAAAAAAPASASVSGSGRRSFIRIFQRGGSGSNRND